jgi:hypothetical protein
MWMSMWPSCPVHPFSMASVSTEINTRVQGTLALGINLNLGVGPIPLRERVDNFWMSLLGMAIRCLYQPSFLNISTPVLGLGRACGAPRGVLLPENMVRQEAHRVCSERLRSQRLRRRWR